MPRPKIVETGRKRFLESCQLVWKLGQALAGAVKGGDRHAYKAYLTLWAGLSVGAVLGALTFGRLGLAALWPAAGFALLMALIVRFSRAA